MPKVKFTKDYKVQQFDGKGPEYKAGEVYDLERSYAEKYVRKGVAEPVADDAVVTDAPKFDASVKIANDWRELKPAQMITLAQQLGGKGIKSGAAAGDFISDALFARAGTIEMNVNTEGDVRTVRVAKPWPAYALIAEALLNDPEKSPELSVKQNVITITAANGMAEYHVVAWNTETVVAALGESTFEEPTKAS